MRTLLTLILSLLALGCGDLPLEAQDAGMEPDPCVEYTTTVDLVDVEPAEGCAFWSKRADSVHATDLLCRICVVFNAQGDRDCWYATIPPEGDRAGDHLPRWRWRWQCFEPDAPRSCWQDDAL